MAAKKTSPKKPKVKVSKVPELQDGEYTVAPDDVIDLNFFDLSGTKAGTKGSSNKFYHAEVNIAKTGNKCQLYTEYGPTGHVQAREWRIFDNVDDARKEMNRIVKSKERKGYVRIDVAQRAIGSADAQAIVKPVIFKNADKPAKPNTSQLTKGQQDIVNIFFGAQNTFVAQTLKCPLGQLSNDQIDKGHQVLQDALSIIKVNKSLSKSNLKDLEDLTNRFYGLIPHNLGAGARGQLTDLLLDDIDKVVKKQDDLETLLDAKQVNAVLKQDADVDQKYSSLNCNFDEVPKDSPIFRFMSSYFEDTKVRGHGYAKERVSRIWAMKRKGAKEEAFFHNAETIAKQCKLNTFASETSRLSNGKSKLWVPEKRPDLNKELVKLFNQANVWLCWHGTRSANLVGITRKGLLIRPTGAAYTGSLYGDGKYFAWQSTKSLNYCDGGYWTGGGRNSVNSRYMFLLDVAFGNQHIATYSHFYKQPPKGFHSVYGKAGHGLLNDEMITYDFNDDQNQARMNYLLEIV